MYSDPRANEGEAETSGLRVIQSLRFLTQLRHLYFREPRSSLSVREIAPEKTERNLLGVGSIERKAPGAPSSPNLLPNPFLGRLIENIDDFS